MPCDGLWYMIVIVTFPGHGLYQRRRDIDLALSFYLSIHFSISHSALYLIAGVMFLFGVMDSTVEL